MLDVYHISERGLIKGTGGPHLHDGKLLGSKRVSSIAGILGMIKLRLGMRCTSGDTKANADM